MYTSCPKTITGPWDESNALSSKAFPLLSGAFDEQSKCEFRFMARKIPSLELLAVFLPYNPLESFYPESGFNSRKGKGA